jgi:NADP-dependent 3-hydroxy acid dehydrogenase YdfG
MKGFKNKVALITGSSQGIGKAIALELAKKGWVVVLNGRKQEKLEIVRSEIEKIGGTAHAIAADVSNFHETQNLIKETIERCGQLNFLINNVGVSSRGYISELHPDVLQQVFASNVNGCIFPTQLALAELRKSKGSVIFI